MGRPGPDGVRGRLPMPFLNDHLQAGPGFQPTCFIISRTHPPDFDGSLRRDLLKRHMPAVARSRSAGSRIRSLDAFEADGPHGCNPWKRAWHPRPVSSRGLRSDGTDLLSPSMMPTHQETCHGDHGLGEEAYLQCPVHGIVGPCSDRPDADVGLHRREQILHDVLGPMLGPRFVRIHVPVRNQAEELEEVAQHLPLGNPMSFVCGEAAVSSFVSFRNHSHNILFLSKSCLNFVNTV